MWIFRFRVEELCDKMLQAGFEVESVEDLSKSMENVVVGRIEKDGKAPERRQAAGMPGGRRRG